MNDETPKQEKRLYKRITLYLYKIGVSPQVKGFSCLREAVRICYDSGASRGILTKKIYKETARNLDSTIVRVERNIRHAVDSLDDKEKLKKINGLVGYEVLTEYEKPTSGMIIYLLAEQIITDMTEE